ncbi:thiol reductant ABC exporter subunit CydC [Devosia sp.]|uniref:thiol reductant ABC exporter subunit CydC n=1 Tax=Devosia sp. TaxID=1871048 RepID=UPI003266A4A9
MNAILYFAPLFARLRQPMLLTLLLSLVTLAAGIALLGLSGWFLTAAALTTAGAAFNLFVPSAGVRGLSFIRILSRYGEKLSGHDATLKLLSDLRHWLFGRLFPLVPLDRRLGRADLISRLLADVEALDTMFLVALGPISTATLAGVTMTTLLAFLLPSAALPYALAFVVAVLVVPAGLIMLSRNSSDEVSTATSALRQSVLDGLDGHQDLVLFGAKDEAEAAMAERVHALGKARRKLGLLGIIATALVQICASASLIAVLLAGLAALSEDQINGPVLVGVLLAVIASFEASATLVRSATRLAGAAAAAGRLQALAETLPPVAEPLNPKPLPAGGTVAFTDVRYGYDPSRPVLDGLSFTVSTGECVAITGPSGAGKSTIAQLLLRLADPQSGTISINGSDPRQVASIQLHQHVALMQQDAPVFLDSIRANLLIGRADADDPSLLQALRNVRLEDFVTALPDGLDTIVGEAGRTVSAGQARRLCLARTLLSGAEIVVLDEPTSGLDGDSEARFLADLPALADGRTMIVITHAEVPPQFHRVLRLRSGRMQEQREMNAIATTNRR